MSEKRFRVVHKQRYDTLANWMAKNPVLDVGEIAVAVYEAAEVTAGIIDEVTSNVSVYMKVGDGTTPYRDLPFLMAKAGDVYAWAKAENKPTYNASEIEDLADFIKDTIEDTNTLYQIVADDTDPKKFLFQTKEKDDEEWTTAYTLVIPDDITFSLSSDGDGKLTLTPSKGDPSTVTIINLDTDKDDIATGSTNVPTSGALADYVDDKVNQAASRVFRFKGSVATVGDLPTDNNKEGDTYHVKSTKAEYSWVIDEDSTEGRWEKLGGIIDLSDYPTKEEVAEALEKKHDLIDENNKLPVGLVDGLATDEADGLMSAEDKAKLDALSEGAIERIIAGDKELPVIDKTVTLAKIAETGNVMDLQQDDDNVLILDGGDCIGYVLEPTQFILNGGNSQVKATN